MRDSCCARRWFVCDRSDSVDDGRWHGGRVHLWVRRLFRCPLFHPSSRTLRHHVHWTARLRYTLRRLRVHQKPVDSSAGRNPTRFVTVCVCIAAVLQQSLHADYVYNLCKYNVMLQCHMNCVRTIYSFTKRLAYCKPYKWSIQGIN